MHTFRVIIHPDRRILAQPHCNVSSWNVDSSIPNTITSSCTTLLITTLSSYTCVIAQLNGVFPAHLSYISDWYTKSTSKTPTARRLRPVQRPVLTEIVHPYPSRGLRNRGWSVMQCLPVSRRRQQWCRVGGNFPTRRLKKSNRHRQRNRRNARSWSMMEIYIVGRRWWVERMVVASYDGRVPSSLSVMR